MTIKKKLYMNFTAILCIMVALFAVSMYGIRRERSAKAMAEATEALRFQMMQNRLTLANYLLSGDTRELDKLHDGTVKLSDLIRQAQNRTSDDHQIESLNKLDNMETDWNSQFASKMVEKRKEVDGGNATVADLQIAYLQADPVTWVKNSNDVMVQLQQDRQKADETATLL